MTTMPHPYQSFVADTARLLREARALPLGAVPAPPMPPLAADAPRVLLFAPHPDDECIIGGLPLRLLRQSRMRIVDVAVTQGSNKERQGPRLQELRAACAFLGFEVVTTAPGGLERINPTTRTGDSAAWQASVALIADLITRARPRVVFCPHQGDANSTHIGTHLLVRDALERQPPGFTCYLVLTEFWAALPDPNVMVESSVEDVADLVAATACHAGEVRRNPYHLSLPAWMQDNVRRGGELVGGQGGAAPDFPFATLYRVERFASGQRQPAFSGGRILSLRDDPASLFAEP
jgi:LmbE family N-acetylglucosaminyl deacetylase